MKPDNQEIARIFFEIADMLELQNIKWKPIAYRNAARIISTMGEELEEIARKGGEPALENIPGIGEHIAKKIMELVGTGKLKYYGELKRQFPFDIERISAIPGIGPKKAFELFKKLKIKTVEDLKRAIEKKLVRNIEGFGEKSEENIIAGLELLEKSKGRMLLGYATLEIELILAEMRKAKEIKKIEIAGSARRMKETVGDLDFLAAADEKHWKKIMQRFIAMPFVEKVISSGKTKTTVLLKNGLNCDLRIIREETWGAGMQYFTGSQLHNVEMRKIAIAKGMMLSEYGLLKGKKLIAGKREADIYKKLGLKYIEPELRENAGEIEAAQENRLPILVKLNDIKGDFHTHSTYSDGINTLEEMANAAVQRKYEYLAISDHYGAIIVANSMTDKRFEKRAIEIEKLNGKLEKAGKKIRIFNAIEANIKKDGRIEGNEKILKQAEIIVASIHDNFNLSKEDNTKRLVNALENRYATIIGHPATKKFNTRSPAQMDFEKVFRASIDNGKFLEINCFPERMDLNDETVRKGIRFSKKMAYSIDSDSHSTEHLRFMEQGVGTARRGWCEKKNILNTLGLKKIERIIA